MSRIELTRHVIERWEQRILIPADRRRILRSVKEAVLCKGIRLYKAEELMKDLYRDRWKFDTYELGRVFLFNTQDRVLFLGRRHENVLVVVTLFKGEGL